jgi:hypothetical protein
MLSLPLDCLWIAFGLSLIAADIDRRGPDRLKLKIYSGALGRKAEAPAHGGKTSHAAAHVVCAQHAT